MRIVSTLSLLLALSVAGIMLTSAAVAEDEKSHEGTVVSAGDGKLTMTDASGGKEHSHKIGADVKISVEGKPGKLGDLKKGAKIKVTMKGANVVAVSTIDTK